MKQHFLRVSPVGAVILKVTQLMPSVCSSLLVCNEERHCVMVGYTDAYTDVSGVFQDPCMTAVILHPLQKHQCMWRYHYYHSAVHLRCLVQAETSPDMPPPTI